MLILGMMSPTILGGGETGRKADPETEEELIMRRLGVCLLVLLLASGAVADDDSAEQAATANVDKWVEEQYEYFKDKVVEIDGVYYSAVPGRFVQWYFGNVPSGIGVYVASWPARSKARQPHIQKTWAPNIPKGTSGMLSGAKVFQVLGPDSMLVRCKSANRQAPFVDSRGSFPGTSTPLTAMYHLSDVSTNDLVTGQIIPPVCVVSAGTHTYITAIGGTNTLLNLKVVGTLSKEAFVDAVEAGLVLECWRGRKRKCRECGGINTLGDERVGIGRCKRCKGAGFLLSMKRYIAKPPGATVVELRAK